MKDNKNGSLRYNFSEQTVEKIVKLFKGYRITLIFDTGVKVLYEGTCGWYDKRVPLGYNFNKKRKTMNIYIN